MLPGITTRYRLHPPSRAHVAEAAKGWKTPPAASGGYCCRTAAVGSVIASIGDDLDESNCHRYTLVSGRASGLSAAAGSLVASRSASTNACGPRLGLTMARLSPAIDCDQSTPMMPAAGYWAPAEPSAASAL